MNKLPIISSSKSFFMLRAMAGIGIVCGLLIVLTYEGTQPRIEELKARALEQAIFQVLPGTETIKAYAWIQGRFVEASKESTEVVYAGYDHLGQLKGVGIEASGQGYADVIRILYGYDPGNQQVIGFYVLESKETPGLGDRIEKDPLFLSNFSSLEVTINEDTGELQNKIIPVKKGAKVNPWEIEGITGATISSRAIGNIIGENTMKWVPRIYQRQMDFKQSQP